MDCKIQWQCTSTCSCDFSLAVALDVWWCSRVLIPPLNCISNRSSPSIHQGLLFRNPDHLCTRVVQTVGKLFYPKPLRRSFADYICVTVCQGLPGLVRYPATKKYIGWMGSIQISKQHSLPIPVSDVCHKWTIIPRHTQSMIACNILTEYFWFRIALWECCYVNISFRRDVSSVYLMNFIAAIIMKFGIRQWFNMTLVHCQSYPYIIELLPVLSVLHLTAILDEHQPDVELNMQSTLFF